ncbi:DUF1381 domain-containing protein, partial [Staphylococcus aureus]
FTVIEAESKEEAEAKYEAQEKRDALKQAIQIIDKLTWGV